MAEEKTGAEQQVVVEQQTTRNATLAPQCPPIGTNQTVAHVRRRRVRYQRKQTYHYHHSP
jgi:hypothetical protein